MIVCQASDKPLVFFHLVHAHGVSNALVFTKSAESTTRLVRLFEFFELTRQGKVVDGGDGLPSKPIVIRAYSSDLGVNERKSILEKFRAKEIQMWVFPLPLWSRRRMIL